MIHTRPTITLPHSLLSTTYPLSSIMRPKLHSLHYHLSSNCSLRQDFEQDLTSDMPNTFVLCVDETLASDEAFNRVAPLVHPGDTLVLLHILEPILSQPIIAFPPLQVTPVITHDASNLEAQKSKAARIKTKYATLCSDHNINYVWREEIGGATDKIKQVVEQLHPTLLVLGSNNKNMLERAFLGSVSRHFAHNAECPVLIVPQHSSQGQAH